MARAQGSLEYLIIIAIVLAVSAIVISYSTGILGGGKSSISVTSCKQAAVDCKAAKMLSSTDPCLPCDTACKDSGGVELFDGATFCCNHGLPEMVFANSPGCYGCKDSTDCSSPTPICLANLCVECADNTNCPLAGTVCSASHACVPGCTDTKLCPPGQMCSSGVCVTGCVDDITTPCPSGQYCCGTAPNKICRAPTCTSNMDCAGTDIPNDCKKPTCDNIGTGCAVCNPTGETEPAGASCGVRDPTTYSCGSDTQRCGTYTAYECSGGAGGTGSCFFRTHALPCTDCGACNICIAGTGECTWAETPSECSLTTCQWCSCTSGICIGMEGCTQSTCYNFCKWC